MSHMRNDTPDYAVFVSNLPQKADKTFVERIFSSCGEISKTVVVDSKYNSYKIAYIHFFLELDATQAIKKCHNLCIDGNILNVRRGIKKHERSETVNDRHCPSPEARNLNMTNGYSPSSSWTGFNNFQQESGADEMTVVVCHIDDIVNFCGHKMEQLPQVERLTQQLQNQCPTFSPVEGTPSINQVYAACFSQDKRWYRCKIISAGQGSSLVLYIDYGNSENVDNKNIVMLPDVLQKIHPQCCSFNFKDLIMDSGKINEGFACMKKMLFNQVVVHVFSCTDGTYSIDKCIVKQQNHYGEIRTTDIYTEIQRNSFAINVSSKSKTSLDVHCNSMSQATDIKNKPPTPTDEKLLKGYVDYNYSQNSSNKCRIDDALRAASTFQRPYIKPENVVSSEDVVKFQLEIEKLAKELVLEKAKSTVLIREVEQMKTKQAEYSDFVKLYSIVETAKKLMEMRNANPLLNDVHLEEIYQVVKELSDHSPLSNENLTLHAQVKQAIADYYSHLDTISNWNGSNDESLSKRINDKEAACQNTCDLIEQYLLNLNNDKLTEKVAHLNKLQNDIQITYKSPYESNIQSKGKSLEDLMADYNKYKTDHNLKLEKIWNESDTAMGCLAQVFDDLHNVFNTKFTRQLSDASISCDRGENSHCFSPKSLTNLLQRAQDAAKAEMTFYGFQASRPLCEALISVLVKGLVHNIEVPLKEIQQEMEDFKYFKSLGEELSTCLKKKPVPSKIYEIRKDVKVLKSTLRHKLADKKDLEERDDVQEHELKDMDNALDQLRSELHRCFIEEQEAMTNFTKEFKTHFPELAILHKDLNLSSHALYQGLIKENWDLDHFSLEDISERPGLCYKSTFCGESVVLKEYYLNIYGEENFYKEALSWNSSNCVNVVPIQAIFQSKVCKQVYAMFPYMETLEECGPQFSCDPTGATKILCDVLKGLHFIHSQGLVQSLLNPLTVFILKEESTSTGILDFCFGINQMNTVCESKGIKFFTPEKDLSEASDMYNFGCLILWLLFPNLSFCCAANGALEVEAYKSIMNNLLSASGYEAVKSLLKADPQARPTAKSLLENDIFANFLLQKS